MKKFTSPSDNVPTENYLKPLLGNHLNLLLKPYYCLNKQENYSILGVK